MGKLALPSIAEPDDCFQAGSLEYYDKAYDRLVTMYPDTMPGLYICPDAET